MKPNNYHGETDAKRIVRLDCYLRAAELIAGSTSARHQLYGIQPCWAVTLCGPDAAELGAFKHLLKWPARQSAFVDMDSNPSGLRKAEKNWDNVKTINDTLYNAIRLIKGPIAFIHLDFMGHISSDVETSLHLIRPRIPRGGVVMVTSLRGRETVNTPHWKEAQNRISWPALVASPDFIRRTKAFGWTNPRLAVARAAGYANEHLQILNGADTGRFSVFQKRGMFWCERIYEYQGGPSPMVVHFYRRTDLSLFKNEAMLYRLRCNGEQAAMQVRSQVLRMMDLSTEEISEIMNIPRGTVAAWRAHGTRGTYDVTQSTKTG